MKARAFLASIVLRRQPSRGRRTPPLQAQLYAELKKRLSAGTLRPGDPLPSSRDLAADLAISRNTAMAVYDRLIGEGYLEARPRSGLYVNEALLPAAPPASAARTPAAPRPPAPPRVWPAPFRPCQPDVRLFPLALWNRLRTRVLRAQGTALLHYQPAAQTMGLPGLRRALAAYLRDSRGVQCTWEQVAVLNGSQQALFLLGQLLLRPGDTALMEDPGYLGAREAWRRAGAGVRPLAVGVSGLMAPDAAGFSGTRLIYTTPSRQFPTGACLPVAGRQALIECARRAGAWIVEDDYDSEFRYTRPPMPSLHGLDPERRVIYLGTMSKVLAPSLRIGYMVLPEPLVDSFAALRMAADDHGPTVDQATLAEFIDSGAFYTHIRRCRNEYARRQEVFLQAAAAAALPLEFPHRDGGMNLTGFAAAGTDDGAWSAALEAAGLDVPALSRYSLSPASAPRGLVFGFTAFEPAAIRAAVRLAAGYLV
ncbi:MAG: PLP-dependent aminotransferase family protein [Bryobacterales bacterium]|nr:PLP-dependent aminotransferase family protein [Bryobacterales bacterium]